MDRKLKEEFIESYRKLTGVTVESAEKIYMEYKNKIEFMLFTLWSMDEISKRILKVKFVLFANVYYIYNKGVKWEEEAMAKFSDNCVAIHQKMGMGIPIQRIVRDIRCLY